MISEHFFSLDVFMSILLGLLCDLDFNNLDILFALFNFFDSLLFKTALFRNFIFAFFNKSALLLNFTFDSINVLISLIRIKLSRKRNSGRCFSLNEGSPRHLSIAHSSMRMNLSLPENKSSYVL